MEKTFAIIKPDVMKKGVVEDVMTRIHSEGFVVLDWRNMQLDLPTANEFYHEHINKPFFNSLIAFMTSGPIRVLVLAKENAIAEWRRVIGPTNVFTARETSPNSLRALYGTDGTANGFHGSDCLNSAKREILFFFKNQRVEPVITGEKAREYLDKTINPILTQALTVLCKEKPENPILYLSTWLSEHNPNKPLIIQPIKPTPAPQPHKFNIRKDIVFVLGGPGSGKGTQSERLADEFFMEHISAGDLLRREVSRGSNDGQLIDKLIKDGALVPQEITVNLLGKEIEQSKKNIMLIDGFPRALDQLSLFEKVIKTCKFVIYFDCSEEVMMQRLIKRGETSGRSDDNEASIRQRFVTYKNATMPVINHFEKLGKLMKINADQHIDEVYKHVRQLFV